MDIVIAGVSLTAITIVLTEIIKTLKMPKRFLPLVSIIVGLILVWLVAQDKALAETIVTGLAIGGAAAGIYDLGKKTVLGK